MLTNFNPRSLVGMSMSARKRAARFDARSRQEFFGVLCGRAARRWILNLWHLGNDGHDPKKLNRMMDFAGEDPNRVNEAEYARGHVYAEARAKYRIGERLKPCRFCAGPELFDRCKGKRIAVDVVGDHRRGECVFCRTCTDAALTLRFENPDACDGSGLIVTRGPTHRTPSEAK